MSSDARKQKLRELGTAMLGELLSQNAEHLAEAGLVLADLGGGVCTMEGVATEGTNARSVVVVLCGSIPDDLVQCLGDYVKGLHQDLVTSGKIKSL